MLTVWLTISLTAIGVGLVAFFFGRIASPIRWNAAFAQRYTMPATVFYLDQPRKTLAFVAGCLATPPILLLSYFLSQWTAEKAGALSRHLMLLAGCVVTWSVFFWCLLPLVYCPNPPFVQEPPSWLLYEWFFKQHLFPSAVRVCYLLMALGICLFFYCRGTSSRNLNGAFLVSILFWAAASPAHFYAPAEVKDDWRFTFHLNPILDAISQVTNGHHLLIDFSHIYGGYPEILGPILLLFPRGIETPLLAFGLINVISVLGLLLTARLVIRQPHLLFLTALALLGVEYLMTILEHYYQYFSIRMIFPSIGLLVAGLYFRHPTIPTYSMSSFVAALACVWNLDTGIVLWLSWTATLLAMGWSIGGWATALRHLGMQATVVCGIWAAFFFHLRMASGQWPDLGMLFRYQHFSLNVGFYCLGIAFPDLWVIILTLYLAGLAISLVFYLRGNPPWRIHVILMLSLMGIGLFGYFMGRSAESNLVSVSFAVILLIGLLAGEAQALIAQQKLPRMAWLFLSPAILILLWWSYLFVWGQPEQTVRSVDVTLKWLSGKPSPIAGNFAFVKQWTIPHEQAYMLSKQSGFYYYLTDTVCPIKMPGTGEIFWREDMDRLVAALDAGQFAKLFVDQDFFKDDTYRPEIYQQLQQAIAGHYRPQATSPSGGVTLFVPR